MDATPKRALVLFAHGARAASWAAPFERLRDLTRGTAAGLRGALAFLELMEPRLPETVARWWPWGGEVTWCRCSWGRAGICCATCRCWPMGCARRIRDCA
jgi:sirohydrochlorin cobaltochelatase